MARQGRSLEALTGASTLAPKLVAPTRSPLPMEELLGLLLVDPGERFDAGLTQCTH